MTKLSTDDDCTGEDTLLMSVGARAVNIPSDLIYENKEQDFPQVFLLYLQIYEEETLRVCQPL